MSIEFNKSQKIVLLLSAMADAGGITAEAAIDTYDLDERTLRRYLSDLRDIDVPVCDEGRGPDRLLSLEPSYGRKGVQLSLLELVSLHFGRTLFDFLKGTGFAEDMDDALERISAWSGGPVGQDAGLVEHLDRKFIAVPEHAKDHTRDGDILDDILTALLRQNPVEALYARVGGPVRTYRLHPYTLAHWRQGLYLFALDTEVSRVKTFAVDRFRAFSRSRGETFEYPVDFEPSALVSDCFGIIGGEVQDIRLQFSRSVAPYVRERTWHHSQHVDPQGGGAIEVSLRVGLSPELEAWVLGFGPNVSVLEPIAFRDRIRRLHHEAATL
jgi:predicted DNA-binding transcriptional regulator YafY